MNDIIKRLSKTTSNETSSQKVFPISAVGKKLLFIYFHVTQICLFANWYSTKCRKCNFWKPIIAIKVMYMFFVAWVRAGWSFCSVWGMVIAGKVDEKCRIWGENAAVITRCWCFLSLLAVQKALRNVINLVTTRNQTRINRKFSKSILQIPGTKVFYYANVEVSCKALATD